jgi:outer membrane protein TolC
MRINDFIAAKITKNYSIKLYICCFLLISPSLYAINLSETIGIALENNFDFKIAKSKLESSEYTKKTVRADYLPSIALSSSASWSEKKTDRSNQSDEINRYDSNNLSVNLNQTILDFTLINKIRKSTNEQSIERLKFKKQKSAIIKKVAEAYIDYLKKISQKRTTELEKKSATTRLSNIRRNYELGNIAKSSLYETQSSYYSALNSLDSIESDVRLSLDKLYNLTQFRSIPTYDISPNIKIERISDTQKDEAIDYMLNNNNDINISLAMIDNSRIDTNIKKSAFLPTLKASISKTFDDTSNDVSNVQPYNGKSSSLVYNLNLSIPIFNGGKDYYQVKQSNENTSESLLDLDNAISNSRFEINKIINEINKNQRSIESLKLSIKSNHGSYSGQVKAYNSGSRTLTDVLSSEKKLFDSIRNYYNTYYDYLINIITLQEIQGDLDLEDIDFLSNKMMEFDPSSPFTIPKFDEG